jgi:general secretion pathway protein E
MNNRRSNTAALSDRHHGNGTFRELSELAPEQIVESLIDDAVDAKASDLFIGCSESEVEVSIRHLGLIKPIATLPLDLGFRCMLHIRAVAGMKFHEKRLPQDGRWVRRMADGRIIDLRLNTMPTVHGESFSIRLLDRASQLRALDSLGLVGSQLDTLITMLHSPSGLILVTGPTGSGKTTTLYACLQYLNDGSRKIHTLEDPVEYAFKGLRQTQLEGNGADFHELLRGVLRQSPDVIMIGEIRDKMTAETAVRAANSGQLVFATLHSPVASAAIQALLSLGTSPYFVFSSLLGVIGQRLMRTLNPQSRVPIDLSDAPRTFEEVEQWLQPGEGKIVYSAAPDGNRSDGYSGRTGTFEVLSVTPAIRQAVEQQAQTSIVAQRAIEEGMIDFRRSALIKVAQGITSFDEMFRVVPTGELWVGEEACL